MKEKTGRYVWFCIVVTFIAAIAAGPVVAGSNRWTIAGPDGAVITAMIADRSNAATLYAATYAGVFKSVDSGELWSPLNNGLSDQVVSALAIRPQAPSAIYAATTGGKVFRSDDSGERWIELAQPASTSIHSIDFAPGGGIVYVATNLSVFRSTDDGATWAATTSEVMPSQFLKVMPNGDIYAGLDALYVSTDQGRTFTVASGLLAGQDRFMAMALDSETMTMYIGTTTGALRSADGGKTWQPLPSITPSTVRSEFGSAVTRLVVNDHRLIAATNDGVVEYADGDKSWTRIGSKLDGTWVSSLVAGGSASDRLLIAGTDAGLLKMRGNQGDWRYANTGLTGAFTIDLALDPTNVSKSYAATRRGVVVTANSGQSWEVLHETASGTSWPIAVAVSPLKPTNIFAVSNDRIEKSSDAGETWKLVTNVGNHVSGFAVAPSDTATVYAALASGMAKSTNGGDTFGSIQATLPYDFYYGGFYGSAVTVDPASSSTVFVGTYLGLYKSETAGSTWNRVSDENSIGALAIDPSDSSNLYAAPTFGVIKSSNGGTAWSESGLMDQNVATIAIDPAHPSIIYAGTYRGQVFRSGNRGGSWIPFSSRLPGSIYKLAIDSSGDRLWAATSRGVYQYQRDLTYLKSAVTYTISLRTLSGNYVSAVDCGDADVTANAQAAGPCETFTLYDVNGGALRNGDEVYLQAANGSFLAAEHGGSNGCTGCESLVVANRIVAASWETFTIRGLSGSLQISSGDAITLQSSAGNYLVAEDGGGNSCGCDSHVKANRDTAREWETFTLSLH